MNKNILIITLVIVLLSLIGNVNAVAPDQSKWEEKQDSPISSIIITNHYLDTLRGNYHTEGRYNSSMYLVPKYTFKTGDTLEYNLSFVNGYYNYSSYILLFNGISYDKFKILGCNNCEVGNPIDEVGIYNIFIKLYGEYLEIKKNISFWNY